jgi:hypothetical protein
MKTMLARCLFLLLLLTAAAPARAQSEPPAKEASRHFQRGVDLYSEGDIRGALVEFKRAYSLLPRAPVLYNIGQAEYQLQEYAPALRTLERFLADTGPNAAHRAEVQQTVEVLRGRVGHLALSSDRAGCEVTIDDQPAGTTPLADPVLVSIGRRKVALACAGSPRVTRDVEVAAGETARLDLKVGSSPAAAAADPTLAAPGAPPPRPAARRGTVAWIVTGALAVATAGVYTAALLEARRLDQLRATYPVTSARLDNQARATTRLALAGDLLAAGTIVSAGVASYLRWGASGGYGPELSFGPTGFVFNGRF